MNHRKKNSGHRMSKIVKSTQSYSIGHLPYYCSLYNWAHALCAWRDSVRMRRNNWHQSGLWLSNFLTECDFKSSEKQGNIEILWTTLRHCTLMVDSVQWISQSEYSIYIIILVKFYEKCIVYRWQKK